MDRYFACCRLQPLFCCQQDQSLLVCCRDSSWEVDPMKQSRKKRYFTGPLHVADCFVNQLRVDRLGIAVGCVRWFAPSFASFASDENVFLFVANFYLLLAFIVRAPLFTEFLCVFVSDWRSHFGLFTIFYLFLPAILIVFCRLGGLCTYQVPGTALHPKYTRTVFTLILNKNGHYIQWLRGRFFCGPDDVFFFSQSGPGFKFVVLRVLRCPSSSYSPHGD